MRLDKWAYVLIIAVALLAGLGLVYRSATHLAHVEGRDYNRMIQDLEALRPDFTFAQAESVRSLLKARDPRIMEETVWDAFLRDLGIALIVAVVLTVVIEFYARNRLQEEIRSGVVEAAFNRLISPAVFNQIKGHVIGGKVLRRNWTIEMFVRPYPKNVEGGQLYLSRTVISSEMLSLTGGTVEESLGAGLDRHLTGSDEIGALPRIERIHIGNEVYSGDAMKPFLQDEGMTFLKSYSIPPSGVRTVVELTEMVRVPDTFVWSTPVQCEGARIVIDASAAPGVAFEVTALSPDKTRLSQSLPGRTWDFDGGLLPWQGFQIRSFFLNQQLPLPIHTTTKEPETQRAPQP